MGYASDAYLGMRPWTRASIIRMIAKADAQVGDAVLYGDPTANEAENLFAALKGELNSKNRFPCSSGNRQIKIESTYSILRAISGTPLQDSFHLGSTVINDYGRPFESGLSNYSGLSGYASEAAFAMSRRIPARPAVPGYSTSLAQQLSTTVDHAPFFDSITGQPYNQATIPLGPIDASANTA